MLEKADLISGSLEEKGYIQGSIVKEGNMAEKAVYSLTDAGEKEFESLALEISAMPIRFFLDFNSVIVNLVSLLPENRELCLTNIEESVKTLKTYLEENINAKENIPEIPETGMAVLQQQFILAGAIETWIASLKENFEEKQ